MKPLFRRKPIDRAASDHTGPPLARELGPWQLVALGIGAIVGAGIFSSIGSAAAGGAHHLGAGPAIVISFLLVAVACALAGLCYAEFAALVPVSGSAYTYAYATLGELVAWVIGWDLILEYAVGNVAVAISWSGYFQELLRGLGMHWPGWLGIDARTALQAVERVAEARSSGVPLTDLGDSVLRAAAAYEAAPRVSGLPLLFNVPAAAVVLLLTWILVLGVRESSWFNAAMVLVKLTIIALFVVVGFFYIEPANWEPFAPNGFRGISGAAAIIFFAYIGFDAITTASEETRDPQRAMPFGILGSLVVCTVIYLVVAMVLTGVERWDRLGTAEPLAAALSGRGLTWASGVVALGAVIATTSVLFVFQLGQPRIFFSMARDGLLPRWAATVHPRYRTPHVTTILTGIGVAAFAGMSNIDEVVELCNIGTLFAFVVVAAGILVLRRVEAHRPRPFRCPWVPWVPLLAMGSCLYLMLELPWITWVRFAVWLAIGLVIYFAYGMRRSTLSQTGGSGQRPTRPNSR
jgi:APA family basic amino acid/polyamine antiporter